MFEVDSRLNVVVVGHVTIDDNTSEHGSKYKAAGGPPVFIDKILNQFPGTTVKIIAPYGQDFKLYGGKMNLYPPDPNVLGGTLVYENDTSSGKRKQKIRNFEEAQPLATEEGAARILEEVDIAFMTPLLPNFPPEYYNQISAHTRRRGALRILVPQGHMRRIDEENNVRPRGFVEALDILPNVDVVITSVEDHPHMKALARHWVRHNRDLISVITEGEQGALIITRDGEKEYSTTSIPKDQVIDTVGCGDSFAAAFGYEYKRTGDIEQAVRFANAVAGQRLRFMADQIVIDVEKARADAIKFQNPR